jgi:hypothetical protein
MRDTLISFCDTARENQTQQQEAAGRDPSVTFSETLLAHTRGARGATARARHADEGFGDRSRWRHTASGLSLCSGPSSQSTIIIDTYLSRIPPNAFVVSRNS